MRNRDKTISTLKTNESCGDLLESFLDTKKNEQKQKSFYFSFCMTEMQIAYKDGRKESSKAKPLSGWLQCRS